MADRITRYLVSSDRSYATANGERFRLLFAISAKMLEKLTAKAGAQHIDSYHGDITTTFIGRTFDLVLCAFNTLFAVCSQEEQVAVLRNAARHLKPGGHLVLETASPYMMLRGFRFNQAVGISDAFSPEAVTLMAGRLRPLEQIVQFHRMTLSHYSGLFSHASEHRYIWPAELDLMAELAGFRLLDRFGSWARDAYTETSPVNVSHYARI